MQIIRSLSVFYGIDKPTLEKLINKWIRRREIIELEIRKWFEQEDDEEKLKIKLERK